MSQHRSAEASSSAPSPSPDPQPTPGTEWLRSQAGTEPDPTSTLLFGQTTPESPTLPPSYGDGSDPSHAGDADPDSWGRSTGSEPELGADGFARGWRARARAFLPTARRGVIAVGGVVHQALTVEGTPENDLGLYLPDEDDVEAIATPLAGLAARRVPAEAANPDITDLIGLAFGVVGYVLKQLAQRDSIRRQVAGGINLTDPAGDGGDAGSPA